MTQQWGTGRGTFFIDIILYSMMLAVLSDLIHLLVNNLILYTRRLYDVNVIKSFLDKGY